MKQDKKEDDVFKTKSYHQDTLTTREKAIEWWDNLPFELSRDNMGKKHFPFFNYTELSDDNIETIYLSEHLQPPVKENDLLEGEEFKMIGIVKDLRKENKQLKEQVKVLEDALQWIEMKSWQKGEWNDMKDINNKAKAALSIK